MLCSILGWTRREVVVPAAPWYEGTDVSSLWGDEEASSPRCGDFSFDVVLPVNGAWDRG
jgi:hypothetical protein